MHLNVYMYSTVVFWQRAFNSGTGYRYLLSVAESMQPEYKVSKRSQPEITILYLNLVNHYVETIFILPILRTGQELATELREWKNIQKMCIN